VRTIFDSRKQEPPVRQHPLHLFAALPFAAVLLLGPAGCSDFPDRAGPPDELADQVVEVRDDLPVALQGLAWQQQEFWDNLREHCGQAYPGFAAIIREGDTRRDELYADREMVAHVRQCLDEEIRIAAHIGDDRSRTWIITPVPGRGLELRHDHRNPDGTDGDVTGYGAETSDAGAPLRQEFTRDGAADGSQGFWMFEMVPEEERLSYGNHDGDEWLVRFDFDLTSPVQAPPAPWGYEDTEPTHP